MIARWFPRRRSSRRRGSFVSKEPTQSALELDIPIEKVGPAFVQVVRRVGPGNREELERRRLGRRLLRLDDELVLAGVARAAGRDDVAPAGEAAARSRDHVIERQVHRRELLVAILAAEAVA